MEQDRMEALTIQNLIDTIRAFSYLPNPKRVLFVSNFWYNKIQSCQKNSCGYSNYYKDTPEFFCGLEVKLNPHLSNDTIVEVDFIKSRPINMKTHTIK